MDKGLGHNAFNRIVVGSVLPTLLAAFEPPPIAMVEVAVHLDQVRPNVPLARFARLATYTMVTYENLKAKKIIPLPPLIK